MIAIDLPLSMKPGFSATTVRAYIVHDLAPHLADIATFAVHRKGAGWSVSNVETGGGVGDTWAISRPAAIEYARQKCAKVSRSFIAARMKRFPAAVV